MLIRDAIQLLNSAKLSRSRKVALVCSFEPLHLRTYLQAFLVQRFPEDAPEVATFGYDQLHLAMAETSSSLRTSPALLCLSWEDIHPALSWRTRAPHAAGHTEVRHEAERLNAALTAWIDARRGAETFVVAPPLDFLPLLDACSPKALGETALTASSEMANLLVGLSHRGARILRLPAFDLNYRDLLLSGCPLSSDHAKCIARTFVDVAFRQTSRMKAVVTDLDGTLWQGVIGEDGPAGIACGPEGKGYPFYVFQQFLLKLKREGVLLAFCSKNNRDEVLPVFDTLGMPLTLSDFSAYRCNWEPKSTGIRSIARELNIGDDAVVVVDDDPVELAEIAAEVPGAVLCGTPREGQGWRDLLSKLQELCATWAVSDEDRMRAGTVASERLRREADGLDRQNAPVSAGQSHLSHLRGMKLDVTIHEHGFDDARSLELINRTNQFNLTGERLAPDQWLDWAATPGAFCWSARLKDRFGDFGTICVITGRVEGPTVHLRQFVLSCRAFGRGVEAIVLGEVVMRHGGRQVRGPFRKTGKNEPAMQFLTDLGCDVESAGEWHLDDATVLKALRTVLEQTGATNRTAALRA